MTTVAMKIMEVKRPVSGKSIGWRIVLAHYNNARYCPLEDDYVQSYAPCYRIAESGDYREVTPDILERFLAKQQQWHNIERIVCR